jgi:hypothetical protein
MNKELLLRLVSVAYGVTTPQALGLLSHWQLFAALTQPVSRFAMSLA